VASNNTKTNVDIYIFIEIYQDIILN